MMNKIKVLMSSALMAILVGIGAVQAEDVTIYLNPSVKAPPPNVLFVLDESGSMSSRDGTSSSRMDDMKAAMRQIIDDPQMADVNAAILGYTTQSGNNGWLRIRYHIGFKKIGGNEAEFKSKVNALRPYSYTPTTKALEAAVDWYLGAQGNGQPGYNSQEYEMRGRSKWDKTRTTGTKPSPVGQYDADGNPLWCQTNTIILLTDGQPNSNSPNSGKRYGLRYYKGYTDDHYTGGNCRRDSISRWDNGRCAREIAAWAYDHDLLTDNDTWPGKQNIKTYTIGFHTSSSAEAFLNAIANNGHGKFYTADNVDQLIQAFSEILQEAKASIPFAYTAPTIPINVDNIAVSGDDVYVPLFVPEPKRFWKGNIKKYHIAYNQSTDSLEIKDRNGQDVLNADSQFVAARDYWNRNPNDDSDSDGMANTLEGGAVSQMRSAVTRKLYTYLGDNKLLTVSANRVRRSNGNITKQMLNVSSNSARNEVLDWINWDNLSSGETGKMGGPLHTVPISVEYPGDDLVFINTTDGMLHAFNARTGIEEWAFIPDELLHYLSIMFNDPDGNRPIYGLDGPLTYYEYGSRKYLVFGMRRGGRNYYALDITEKTQPRFAWEIIGGSGDFQNLGQTWSKPLFVKLNGDVLGDGSVPKYYLIFGGGYDDDQDSATTRLDDDMGNAIYIVDPLDGSLVKEINTSDLDKGEMTNGIAADLLPIDINANGVVDRIYAADVGGRIIRVDIPDAELVQVTGIDRITASVIADVNLDANGNLDDAANTQRFFNTPEVAYYDRGGERYLALLIGSGNRPEPLATTVQDRFYMIKDHQLWTAPSDGNYDPIITEPDLYDATDNYAQEGADGDCNLDVTDLTNQNQTGANKRDCAVGFLKNAKGWYINLGEGEKVFSEAKVYDYVALFTSYKPKPGQQITNPCQAKAADGEAFLYAVNMVDAGAMFENDNNVFDSTPDAPLDKGDRAINLNLNGMMPPSPTLLFPKSTNNGNVGLGGVVVALIGLKAVAKWADRFHPVSWEEVIED